MNREKRGRQACRASFLPQAGKRAGTQHMLIGKGRREVKVRSKGYEVGEKG